MEEYVEFSGKDVDDAIANACRRFGIERDKLEIEIVSGGSSGIFGLVGVKKARIRARVRPVFEEEKSAGNNKEASTVETAEPKPVKKPGKAKARPKSRAKQDKQKQVSKPVPEKKPQPEPETAESSPKTEETKKNEEVKGSEQDDQPLRPDDPELREYVHSLLVHLTEPLAPEADISINVQTKPISVTIKDQAASELLIGKDGQTLSAIQYIANRIIAKNRPGAARVQLDTEDFLEKQNEKLQQSAFQLAGKAKKIGKTMSTRPLSSYHRRIVHMALQSDKKIRTKSKGDGPMKRVLIMPRQKRKKPSQD